MDGIGHIATAPAPAFVVLMPTFNAARNLGRVRVLAGLAIGAMVASAHVQDNGLAFEVALWLIGS